MLGEKDGERPSNGNFLSTQIHDDREGAQQVGGSCLGLQMRPAMSSAGRHGQPLQVQTEGGIRMGIEGPADGGAGVTVAFHVLKGCQKSILIVALTPRFRDCEETLGGHDVDVGPVGDDPVHREVDAAGFGLVLELIAAERRIRVQLSSMKDTRNSCGGAQDDFPLPGQLPAVGDLSENAGMQAADLADRQAIGRELGI